MSRALRLLDDVLSLVRERDEAVLRDTVARIESMQLQLADARRELREEQDAHAETCRALSELDGRANRAVEELAAVRSDCARISKELGLPPTMAPAEGELARLVSVSKHAVEECERLRAERDDLRTAWQALKDSLACAEKELASIRPFTRAKEGERTLESVIRLMNEKAEANAYLGRVRKELGDAKAELVVARADLARAAATPAHPQPHPDLPVVPGHEWRTDQNGDLNLQQLNTCMLVGWLREEGSDWLAYLHGHGVQKRGTKAEAAAALAARVVGGGG